MSTQSFFIYEAYQYYRQDIFNQARIELMQAYNIPIPGSVSHRLWQLFGAILTGRMGRSGSGLDLQDYEVKSSREGASFEYQYHLNTGETKLLEDMRADHIFISYSPDYQIDLGQELVSLGVPKEDIVLGFHSPFMRQFTDYAVS